ncbi:DUF11 domain-containing protein [Cellulomonas sp. zg-ZUI222]|uniref:DUF11 domain-containing protein n=1 Tax=Cellulomonas wangleii TaxID=2816956 RepID=A0ABX8D1U6_9CELL|nr:CshA/CshB family fibrillar adhesin-related protein [Cellulomonas wangleii]MBO0920520.1 DUF11 domain-containing protein [Cellulomonas wangleii]MBO0923062.1 DUF11 domain-containing protein [Cellulomonas wangleii]QVI61446.1 DUF11 domain-containing protein [Cellulomonas wangleii]
MHSTGRRSTKGVTRGTAARILAGTVAAGLGLALVPVLGVTTAASADVPATGSTTGAAIYSSDAHSSAQFPEIAWVSWAPEGQAIANGTSVTNWHAMGDDTWLEVTCTLTNLSGVPVTAYKPFGNTWVEPDGTVGSSKDGLGQLYPGMPPAGIRQDKSYENSEYPNSTSLTVACDAAVVGYAASNREGSPIRRTPVDLGGLVLADAESLNVGEKNGVVTEHVAATAAPTGWNTPWRVIDTYHGGCSYRTHTATATVSPQDVGSTRHWTANLHNTAAADQGQCLEGSSTAVLLAEGVQTLDIDLLGQGLSAVAVGYVLGVDHGDAPADYGMAGALVRPRWEGPLLWEGTHDLAGYTSPGQQVMTPISTRVVPTVTLGADARANTTVPFSADATEDTPDEEAFGEGASPAAIAVEPVVVTSYTLGTARCREGQAYVAAWLDWDGNGRFDEDERSDVVPCPGGSSAGTVNLTWSSVPADVVGGTSYLRLRAAADTAELGSATGPSLAGETEDWQVQLLVTRLALAKSADVSHVTPETTAVRYTVTLTNTGNVAVPDAHVVDDVSDVRTYGTVASATATSGTAAVVGDRVTWSGSLAAGETVTLTYELTGLDRIPSTQDETIHNVARATTAAPGPDDPVGCEPGSVDERAGRCATVDLPGVGLSVEKSAAAGGTALADGARLAPGTTVTWTYVVRNTGSLPLHDVKVADLVTETRNGSPLVTDLRIPLDCGRHGSGTDVTLTELAVGGSVTCTAERPVVPPRT